MTLKGACSYVLYWTMEDGHTAGVGLYESNQVCKADCNYVDSFFRKIVNKVRFKKKDYNR